LGLGDGDWGLRGEGGGKIRRGGGQEGQLVGGSGMGGGNGGGHVVHGAEGDGMELARFWHDFDARGPDFGLEGQGTDGFAEKSGLFVLRFGEGNGDFGAEKGDGEAGKAGSAAEVEKGWARAEMPGGEEAFSEVTADDLFGVADRCEVGAGVPFEEEVEIEGELGENFGGRSEVGGQECGDLGFGEGGHADVSISDAVLTICPAGRAHFAWGGHFVTRIPCHAGMSF